jgi:hypothetical protein
MKGGDFTSGIVDDEWQVFKTAHIEAAMARWNPTGRNSPMTALGVDIAEGGPDEFVMARRHGSWFDELKRVPGKLVPDGPTAAGLIFSTMRNGCEVVIDMGGGYGGSTRDHLRQSFSPTLFNGSEVESIRMLRDRTGKLAFYNARAAACWHFREALDPDYGSNVALPPDPKLKQQLSAFRWKMTARGILVEAKEEIRARIGRSPDDADAIIMAYFVKGKTTLPGGAIGSLQTRAITSERRNQRGKP